MQKNGVKLTVFFEEPFWVGLYQRWSGPKLEVAKITFGAEPKDGEVYQFLLEHWKWLSSSPPVEQEIPEERESERKSTAADKEAPPLFQGFLEGKAGLFAM